MTTQTTGPEETRAPSPRRGLTRYRLLAVAGAGLLAVLVGTLLFGNLNGNLVYYLEPGEAVAQRADLPDGTRFQLGGLVVPDTVVGVPGLVRFEVGSSSGPDATRIPVEYRGAPAQLFGAGIGVVLEGSWQGATFSADTMKVKHDENYRPPPPQDATPEPGR